MKNKVKFLIILLLIVFIVIFIYFKREQLKTSIQSKEMSLYLDFDSYVRQFGYPANKEEFDKFVDYCENVIGYENEIWENEYYLKSTNDSVNVYLKSMYFLKDINVLGVKKRKDK